MKNLVNFFKKSPVILALVGLLVVPMMVKTYALDNPGQDSAEQVEQTNQTATEEAPAEEEQSTEEQLETPVDDPVEQPAPQDPEAVIDNDGVTLGEAQLIAQAEHPGVALKNVKTKVIDGNTAYVFHFEDGWKVAVRATDGVVVELKDASNRAHACKNKLKEDAQFQAWLQQRKEQRRGRHDKKDQNRRENRAGGRFNQRRHQR